MKSNKLFREGAKRRRKAARADVGDAADDAHASLEKNKLCMTTQCGAYERVMWGPFALFNGSTGNANCGFRLAKKHEKPAFLAEEAVRGGSPVHLPD